MGLIRYFIRLADAKETARAYEELMERRIEQITNESQKEIARLHQNIKTEASRLADLWVEERIQQARRDDDRQRLQQAGVAED